MAVVDTLQPAIQIQETGDDNAAQIGRTVETASQLSFPLPLSDDITYGTGMDQFC